MTVGAMESTVTSVTQAVEVGLDGAVDDGLDDDMLLKQGIHPWYYIRFHHIIFPKIMVLHHIIFLMIFQFWYSITPYSSWYGISHTKESQQILFRHIMFHSLKASFFLPFPFPKNQASQGKYYGPLPADVESLGSWTVVQWGRVIEGFHRLET